MSNQIMLEKLCKFIAQTYAIRPECVIAEFEKTRSIDHIIDMATEGKFNG